MVSAETREKLFWGVCIPLRILLAHVAMKGSKPLRAAAVVVAGRWLLGYESSHVGFFGGRAWWRELRKTHGVLWGLYALTGSGPWLAIDVGVGVTSAALKQVPDI